MSDPATTLPAANKVATPVPEPAPITETAPRGIFSVLRGGPFARYAAGDAISTVGYWMQTAAQSLVMTNLTNKAFELGLVNFFGGIPMLALTMHGGTVADRFDKRKIIIGAQLVQIVLAVLVGWLVATGRIQIWHIFAATALLGITGAFEMPATSALVPELVTREEIATAMAVDRSIFHGSRMIGFGLAGYVIGRFGNASAFFINAASFVTSIAAIASVAPRARGTVEEEKQRASGMKAGVDYVRRDKPTMAMLGLMASSSLFVFPFMSVMLPLFARKTLGLDERLTSYLMAFSGIGAVAASFGIVAVARPRRMLFLTLGTADVVFALAGLGLSHTFVQAAAALGALGVGTAFNFGVANTTVQERAPGTLRGRVSALAMLSFIGVMPFASLGVTAFADRIGFRTAIVCGAVGYGAAALFALASAGRRCTGLPVGQAVATPAEA